MKRGGFTKRKFYKAEFGDYLWEYEWDNIMSEEKA